MSKWDKVSLGSLVDVIDPHPSHRAPDEVVQGIPFLGIGDLNEDGTIVAGRGRIVSESIIEEHSQRYCITDKTIGFGRVATIGKVINFRKPTTKYVVSPTLALLEPKAGVNRDYILHVLKSRDIKEQIERLLTGSTRSSLGIELLRKLLVVLPSDEVQESIVNILNTIENQISITQLIITKYTVIKQGMMADLFSRGIDTSTGQLRSSFEEAPELYHETDLGWLPKGWKVVELAKVSLKITDGDHHTPERSKEGVLLLSARNVRDGYLDLSNVDYVPRIEYQRMIKRCFPEAGDILISCSGSIGRVCEVPEKIEFSLVRSVALVKLNRDVANSNYIAWYLRTDLMQKAMINSALQAAQPNLFQGPIEKLKVIHCNTVEQSAIAERLNAIENESNANKKQLSKLKLMKQGLMQDLLTGKVSVV